MPSRIAFTKPVLDTTLVTPAKGGVMENGIAGRGHFATCLPMMKKVGDTLF